MAITLLDYVESKLGPQESYSGDDFFSCGVPIMAGCEICHATLGGYNAYPSKSGYTRCHDCIGDSGFGTVKEFEDFEELASNG